MAAIMGKNNEKFIGMSGGVAVSSGWLALTLLATIYIFCSSSVTFSPLSLGKYCENLTIWWKSHFFRQIVSHNLKISPFENLTISLFDYWKICNNWFCDFWEIYQLTESSFTSVRNQACPFRLLEGRFGDTKGGSSKEAWDFKIDTKLPGDMQDYLEDALETPTKRGTFKEARDFKIDTKLPWNMHTAFVTWHTPLTTGMSS